MSLTCAQARELYAAYALEALDADERAAVQAHLVTATHEAGCLAAYAEMASAAARVADSVAPVTPSAGLWSAIEKQIAPPVTVAAQEPTRSRGGWIGWAVAAAAIAALAWTGWSRQQLTHELASTVTAKQTAEDQVGVIRAAKEQCTRELATAQSQLTLRTEAVALLESPSTRVIALGLQKGAEPGLHATAIINLEQKTALLISNGAQAPTQKDFELWVIKGNDKRAAGLLRADPNSKGTLISRIDPSLFADTPDAFAVTLEPAGGGPQPRGTLVLVGALPKT